MTDAHKMNKMCCNGGTTGQGVLYSIEKHGSNQHAINVNLSLIYIYSLFRREAGFAYSHAYMYN